MNLKKKIEGWGVSEGAKRDQHDNSFYLKSYFDKFGKSEN